MDVPKTIESIAEIPLVEPRVLIPLELWRQKSGNPQSGWVFPSRNDTPVDLHNLLPRVIVPHVEGSAECGRCKKTPEKSPVAWKGLYAGRRGACTMVVETTNGNCAVAQALLRHKSMKTTLDVYKKQITPEAFKIGLQALAAAPTRKKLRARPTYEPNGGRCFQTAIVAVERIRRSRSIHPSSRKMLFGAWWFANTRRDSTFPKHRESSLDMAAECPTLSRLWQRWPFRRCSGVTGLCH